MMSFMNPNYDEVINFVEAIINRYLILAGIAIAMVLVIFVVISIIVYQCCELTCRKWELQERIASVNISKRKQCKHTR